jgi:hypothetical protein
VFMGCKTALFPHRGSDQFISVREDIAEDNHKHNFIGMNGMTENLRDERADND